LVGKEKASSWKKYQKQKDMDLVENAFAINAPTGFYKLAAKIFDLPEFAA
jgi:hypothetical protein